MTAKPLRYRVSHTLDPEERLEDAAMAKAMHDALGCEIVSEGEAEFGRDRWFSGKPRQNIAYWRDAAFLQNAGRPVQLCDWGDAEKAVKALHAEGRDAFVKSTALKLFALPVPVGTSLGDALGALAYSVCDAPPCILVQPFCEVRWEARFVSVGRAVVASSPIAAHLTPISRLATCAMFETPRDKAQHVKPAVRISLTALARKVAAECQAENVVIDCALIDGEPGVVEFNPFSVGNFGLYACDPHAIAQAFAAQFQLEGAAP